MPAYQLWQQRSWATCQHKCAEPELAELQIPRQGKATPRESEMFQAELCDFPGQVRDKNLQQNFGAQRSSPAQQSSMPCSASMLSDVVVENHTCLAFRAAKLQHAGESASRAWGAECSTWTRARLQASATGAGQHRGRLAKQDRDCSSEAAPGCCCERLRVSCSSR